MKTLVVLSVLALSVGVISFVESQAAEPKAGNRSPSASPLGTPIKTYFNRNNISTVFWNNGYSDIDINDANSGFVFPKGSHKTAIFKSGVIWGGKIGGEVRVGGSTYRTGLQEGRILPSGIAEDPLLPHVRIYRVRPDYLTGDVSSEVADEGIPAATVRQNYQRDWNEWLASSGAPFNDIDMNGQYDPFIDVPGIKGADKTIWYVANDLSAVRTLDLYGSNPMGLELQMTIWGYNQPGPLGNTIFKSYLLINRGTNTIDSMYISQWFDADVGDSNDDFAGCDSTLGLGYTYNAFESEATYAPLPPPAVGFDMLQGPLVNAPGDSAIFKRRRVYNKKNLGVSAHYYFIRGDIDLNDPELGSYINGTLQFYNFIRGRIGSTGQIFIDPNGRQTRFALDGDPVAGTGWIDGQLFPPADRRNGVAAGPFVMVPGDSQEIVIGQMAAGAIPGVNRLTAISLLKYESAVAQGMHGTLFRALPPVVSANVVFPSGSQASVKLIADGRPARAQLIAATLKRQNGSVITSLQLYDDGLHGDGDANDGIFANTGNVTREQMGVYASLVVNDNLGQVISWEHILDRIAIAGPLNVRGFRVFSDNINNNGQPNPGEDVRYGFTTSNPTTFSFYNVQVVPSFLTVGQARILDTLTAGGVDSMVYTPNDPRSYFSILIPSNYTDTLFHLPINISDASFNDWHDTLVFRVYLIADSVRTIQINRLAGTSTGDFKIVTVYPSQLRDHLYVIRGVDQIDSLGTPSFTLRDSTDGRFLLVNHLLPDELGHNIPVTDGFKVLRGTINTSAGMGDWNIPSGVRRFTFADADPSGLGFNLEGFEHSMGWAKPTWFSGSTVNSSHLRNVLLTLAQAPSSTTGFNNNPGFTTPQPYAGWNRLTTTDENMSYAYRYLRLAGAAPARPEFAPYIVNPTAGQYAYQDYKKGMPFSAWDVDANPPRRLAVGFLENNVALGMVDGCWWPIANGVGQTNLTVREWFFIFDMPYTGATPDTVLQKDIFNRTLPIMWWGLVNRRNGNEFPGPTGLDQFLILSRRPPSSSDVWTFNPTILVGVDDDLIPYSFALSQNYPNPFNPSTTIHYTLPAASNVTLNIYNILGQKVRTLVNEQQIVGEHVVRWDGTNDAKRSVATGVYFYRIEIKASDRSEYTMVKKMLLLK